MHIVYEGLVETLKKPTSVDVDNFAKYVGGKMHGILIDSTSLLESFFTVTSFCSVTETFLTQ